MSHLLFIEDDLLTVKLYERAFRNKNFEFTAVYDAKSALEALRSGSLKPDLLLLDLILPDMNGYELLQLLKSQPDTKDIPVVILSNFSGDDKMEKGKELGAALVLIKNEHRPDEIVNKVEEFLKKGSRKRGVAG